MAYNVTPQYDVMTSHNGLVCVSQSITKKRTLGQTDCTFWETREVHERSAIFIAAKNVLYQMGIWLGMVLLEG